MNQARWPSFGGDQSGSVAVVFAIASFVVFGFVGMAVDYGRALDAKTRLQRAADSAALAGASLPATASANRVAAGQRFFRPNLSAQLAKVVPVIEASNAKVTVSAAYVYPTVLMPLLRVHSLTVYAHATAAAQVHNGGVACLLALSRTAPSALHLQGVNKISSDKCWSWVNSTHPQSIYAEGASIGAGQGFCTAGAVRGADHFTPAPFDGCDPLPDPFATKTAPPSQSCTVTNLVLSNGSYVLNPGTYCGGLVLKPQASVRFNPGLYVIKDGRFTIQGQASAVGQGVVFVFSGANAEFSIQGGGSARFSAPSTGAPNVGGLEGFVFYQDASTTTAGRTLTIQGGGDVQLEGLLYAPTWQVSVGGNGEMNQNSRHFAMVADSFHMEGNGKLYVRADPGAAGLPDLMPKIKNGPLLME